MTEERNEYARGYRDGYLRGVMDTRKGMTETNMDAETMDIPLRGTELSARAQNCLARAGCATVRDVAVLPENRIGHMKNLGPKTADEIARVLHKKGIHHTAWDRWIL